MKTLTLNLTDREMEVLSDLSKSNGLTKTGTLKLALRMYQNISIQRSKGWRLDFVDPDGRSHNQIMAESFIGPINSIDLISINQ